MQVLALVSLGGAALQALTIGAAASNLLPAKVGILIRAHLVCRRARIGHPAMASSLALEAMLDVVVLLALLLLAVATMGMDPALRGGSAAAAGALALMLGIGAWLSRGSGVTRARGVVVQRLVPGVLRRRAPAATGAAVRETGLQVRRGVHSLQ